MEFRASAPANPNKNSRAAVMDEDAPSVPDTVDTPDEQMGRQLAERWRLRPDHQPPRSQPSKTKLRRICDYCYQPGNHRTVKDCLRALERSPNEDPLR